jgi:tight adherence protein B
VAELIVYIIPAAAFLFVGALVFAGLSYWVNRFGAESKAKAERLRQASEIRSLNAQTSLAKNENSESDSLLDKLIHNSTLAARLKFLLLRAGSGKTPGQLMGVSVGLGLLVFFFGFVISPKNLGLAALAGLIGVFFPILYLRYKAEQYKVKFESQLPEALDFLARALRAGHGLTSALAMVGDEMGDPIGREFKRTFDEINFGIAFHEAISNMAARVNSTDLSFFVVALLIQRETGGNLAELLEGLAKTIRDRMKLAGKVKVISAEGRTSGMVIGAMPFALAGVLSLLNPRYMGVLWNTPSGQTLVLIGLIMMGLGMIWISKIVKVKV